MRSSDYSSQSPQQILQSIAATLATAIVRMHARGMLDQLDPDAISPKNLGKTARIALSCPTEPCSVVHTGLRVRRTKEIYMQSIAREVAVLKQTRMAELKSKYAELFGEECRANNKSWLVKRIAWRIQALAEGDLSERARQRAAEIANDADLRLSPPRPRSSAAPERTAVETIAVGFDPRLPPPGTILTRAYKGQELQVLVLPDGFEYAGRMFKSLSAVAKEITGSHCNGFLFFGLKKEVGNDAGN